MTETVDYGRINALGPEGDWTDSFTPGRYRQFARHMRPDAIDVLDCGCHTGAGGRVLKTIRPQLRVVGLDVCPEFIATLPEDCYAGGFACSATAITAEDRAFDVVLAGEFIEHLVDGDVEPAIRECHRVLRPRGQLLLTTPNPGYLRLVMTGGSVLGGSHLSEHEAPRLCQRLAEAGFGSLRVLGSGRVSKLVGERFPVLAVFGSYLVVAQKS